MSSSYECIFYTFINYLVTLYHNSKLPLRPIKVIFLSSEESRYSFYEQISQHAAIDMSVGSTIDPSMRYKNACLISFLPQRTSRIDLSIGGIIETTEHGKFVHPTAKIQCFTVSKLEDDTSAANEFEKVVNILSTKQPELIFIRSPHNSSNTIEFARHYLFMKYLVPTLYFYVNTQRSEADIMNSTSSSRIVVNESALIE
jgi:hypothetical protein